MSRPRVYLYLAEQFAANCEALGIAAPAAIGKARDAVAAAEDAARVNRHPNVLEMSPEEIREAVTQISIRSHAGRGASTPGGFGAGIEAIRNAAELDAHEASLPELERIVEELRPRFDELAEPLVIAARDYHYTLKTTAADVIDRDDEKATAAWRNARKAWLAIVPIVQLRIEMCTVFDLRPTRKDSPKFRVDDEVNYSVLFAAGDNWALTPDKFMSEEGSLDWLALARAGLRLNSPREVDAKLEARDHAVMAEAIRAQKDPAADREAGPTGAEDAALKAVAEKFRTRQAHRRQLLAEAGA
jgi:hypothetical protein